MSTAILARWTIENDSRWTMDVTLTEDTSACVRQAKARAVLSWLRIFADDVAPNETSLLTRPMLAMADRWLEIASRLEIGAVAYRSI